MTTEHIKWEIEVIKRRFAEVYQLDITYEQAEKIYQQEKFIGSIIHYFSVWEEVDYSLSYLQGVLDSYQLERFINIKKESVKRYEEWLVEQDQEFVNQVKLAEEKLIYYNEKLLPSILGDYELLLLGFDSERPKINYLKAEYKKYLDIRKKESYLNHFRNSRIFQPNGLKLSLINHQLNCLFPDYNLFREQMDEPTKTIRDYLKEKLTYYSGSIDEKLKAILQDLQAFISETVRKYLGEISGCHTDYRTSEKQEKEYGLMCVVLLDKNQYGC